MPSYQVPGVYLEEVSGSRPIQAVGTSTALFIQVSEKDIFREPLQFINWSRFEDKFGPPPQLPVPAGSKQTDELKNLENDVNKITSEVNALEKTLAMLKAEAGEPPTAKIQKDIEDKQIELDRKKKELDGKKTEVERKKPRSEEARQDTSGSNEVYLYYAVKGFFENGGAKCYVVTFKQVQDIDKDRLDKVFSSREDISTIVLPGLSGKDITGIVSSFCEEKKLMAIVDGPAKADSLNKASLLASISPSPYLAFYYPWLITRGADGAPVVVPPSGHMAGVWARTDYQRGVHKAPANVPIVGFTDLSETISHNEQGSLNDAGINCIRSFPNEGTLVWGARTLAPQSEFTYLNVRRLFNMVNRSIARSTRWIVFEPNDYSLWKSITRDVSAFLTVLWRDGMLMGRSPEEAFFVKCDEETNPKEFIDLGRVTTVIGIAPVKPAEFVIFKISQSQENNA